MLLNQKQETLLDLIRHGSNQQIYNGIWETSRQELQSLLVFTARYDTQGMVSSLASRMEFDDIKVAIDKTTQEQDIAAVRDIVSELSWDQQLFFGSRLSQQFPEEIQTWPIFPHWHTLQQINIHHWFPSCSAIRFHQVIKHVLLFFIPPNLIDFIYDIMGGILIAYDDFGYDPLMYTVVHDLRQATKYLLKQKADPFLYDQYGISAFSTALQKGNTHAITEFLKVDTIANKECVVQLLTLSEASLYHSIAQQLRNGTSSQLAQALGLKQYNSVVRCYQNALFGKASDPLMDERVNGWH